MWSFHRTNIAFGFSANAAPSASGFPARSASTGVDPVVSTAMPRTCAGAAAPASRSASRTDASMLSR